MIARIATAAWLVVVWLVATESFTPASIIGGSVVAVALTTLFHLERAPSTTTFRPLAALSALGYFLVKLAHANVQVARAVIAPSRTQLRPGIVAVPVVPCSDLVLWLLANAVSLTPGTSIIELRRDEAIFYVHVLLLSSIDDVRVEVLRMQRRLLRALGPLDCVADADRRIAEILAGPPVTQEPTP